MKEKPLRKIFLSTVTNEFGPHRRLLKGDLSLPSVKVQEQGDFVQGGGKLLRTLDDYIRNDCDAVIHLAGSLVGAFVKADEVRWLLETYTDFATRFPFLAELLDAKAPTLSYTQMEAWLALYHRKRCQLYRPHTLVGEPLAADHPQQIHWKRFQDLGEHYGTFTDISDLRIKVLRDLHTLFPQEVPQTYRPNNLPYASIGTLFKGRDEFLQQLRSSLRDCGDHRATAITGRAVHGLGGVGKTRLAVEYAWQHADEYSAVLCVTADSPENLNRNLAELTGPLVLDLDEHSATEEEARVAAALRWLQSHPGWFLILDNVDTEEAVVAVEDLLAKLRGGQVLITSRLARFSDVVEALELDVLSPDAGAKFLLDKTQPRGRRGRRKTDTDEADALTLAKELDGLALAMEQAGAYIVQLRRTFDEYLTLWRSHEENVQEWLNTTIKYAGPTGAALRSVAVTWQATIDQLGARERELLDLLAWFAPEPVPLSIFASLNDSGQRDKEPFETAISNLADFSMLTWDVETNTVKVHRVVQEILRTRQSDAKGTLTIALALLNDAIPDEHAGDVRTWPAWEPIRPHVGFAAMEGKRVDIPVPTSRMMGELGTMLWAKALHREAETLERDALAIDEQHFGPESTEVALRLNNLAQTLRATNRLSEAEPLMRRALAIDEQSYGPEHLNVARHLNNLAQLLKATNRLLEAEPLMRRALAIDEQSYGPEHPDVAIDLNNLALLLKATNRLSEAEPLMGNSLQIFATSLGREHPNTQTVLANYQSLLIEMGLTEEEALAKIQAKIQGDTQ
ncbi:MAG: tetratricopeptide repeat protein [Planctomycetota bacterium]